jgi:cellulose synthase operon protein YhjU
VDRWDAQNEQDDHEGSKTLRESSARRFALHNLPYLSAYLQGLSEQVTRTQGEKSVRTPSHFPESHQPLSPPSQPHPQRREAASHPVGDRRTKVVTTEQPEVRPSLRDAWAMLFAAIKLTAVDFLTRFLRGKKASVRLTKGATGEFEHEEHRRASPGVHPPIGNRRTSAEPFVATATLGRWSFYFIVKLGMYWRELISFHPLPNLLFAAFILIPARSRFWQRMKNVITGLVGLTLFYYDSWLPPISRLISQASLLSEFSFSYLIELLSRFVSFSLIGALIAAWAVYRLLSRWLRVGMLVMVSMLVLLIMKNSMLHDVMYAFKGNDKGVVHVVDEAKPDMDKVVQDFFDKEAERSVTFTPPPANAVPFDVIFLQVCSLSWSDVLAAGLDQHPLWKRFDILLTKFNSAASYSGPSAIHLLRATCGQPKHESMYTQTAEKCYLMDSMRDGGFEPNFAMNHNGKFDDFLGQVKTYGRLQARPLSLDGLNAVQYGFDNAPIYDDFSVLNRWLVSRSKSDSARVALYYNTTTLHDGNHLPGTRAQPNTLKTYGDRLSKLLDNMENFMLEIERSGRRAVVVMVPEHGAALRGDKRQISGLREIPTPAITLVPVGIKVIGGNVQRAGDRLVIDQSTSFLAVSHIVARMLEKSPFTDNRFTPADYVVDMPTTPYVAQNEKTTVAEYRHRYYLNRGLDEWEEYTEFNTPEAKE